VIGALLPELIQDAQIAVRQADTGPERRATQAVLAEVYSLATVQDQVGLLEGPRRRKLLAAGTGA
jgi:hypothetical protein